MAQDYHHGVRVIETNEGTAHSHYQHRYCRRGLHR